MDTVLRVAFAYIFVWACFRVLGKRELTELARQGNQRARQLYHQLRSTALPEPADASANVLRQIRESLLKEDAPTGAGTMSLRLSCLEAPSNALAFRLEMAARQDRIRQGITGPDLSVPPGVSRFAYPCYMPEWLETSRTSRMTLITSAQLKDPRGNLRWVVADADGRITMSIEGALLKVSQSLGEMTVKPGADFEVPVKVSRSAKLPEAVRLELQVPEELAGMVKAEPVR